MKSLDLKPEYNTDENDVIGEFYRPCLDVATQYDRAVGYFRANIYREMGEEILDFAIEGGEIRICCSPDIPEQDEEAARTGYEMRGKRPSSEVESSMIKIFKMMEKNAYELDCLTMLSILIENGSLDLYIATRPGGIYHRKIGAFYDEENSVVFSGSSNETLSAVSREEYWGNDEEFDVFRSWGDDFEARKVRTKIQYLKALFSGGTGKTKVRSINKIEKEYLKNIRTHRSLEECREGARRRTRIRSDETVEESGITPYLFQEKAIQAWKSSGVGIICMATGIGKTITALFAIDELLESGTPILIVVPSNILLEQWRQNMNEIYPDVPILLAGGGHGWKAMDNKRIFVTQLDCPRVVIATMHTASSNDFIEFFSQADSPALIADEVHRLGSPTFRRILDINFKYRMGLSATPERHFDKEGTEVLENAFGDEPTFQRDIGDKVELRERGKKVPILGTFLSPYYYQFEVVQLTDQEREEWEKKTKEISQAVARHFSRNKDEEPTLSKRIKRLLINRARIHKNAREKVGKATEVISREYPKDGRWIVYCDNLEQLSRVIDAVRETDPGVAVLEYHSNMSNSERKKVLDFFKSQPSIMVSIGCLDEGVNIREADGALILASSTNPREYIQRRGRVLRKAKGKRYAKIVDVLVIPEGTAEFEDFPYSFVKSEIARAWSFSRNAENAEIKYKLWDICVELDIDPTTAQLFGMQSEEMED